MHALRLASALLLLAPAALAAQRPAAAPPAAAAAPVVRSFRDFGGHYGGWLVAAFDSIPASDYGYRPTPAQQSVGHIAQHLESANYALCERIGGVAHQAGPKDALPETVKAAWPKDTLVARLRASLVFCGEAFARVGDAAISEPVPAGAPGSGATSPRVRQMLFFVTDVAEHYAQVASYMRQLGLVPPSALPRPAAR